MVSKQSCCLRAFATISWQMCCVMLLVLNHWHFEKTCICLMKACLSSQACLDLSKKSSPTLAPSLSTTALNVSMRLALSLAFRLQVIPLSSTASWPLGVTSRFPGCRSPCHILSWKTWLIAGQSYSKHWQNWRTVKVTICKSMSAPLLAKSLCLSGSLPGSRKVAMETPDTHDSINTRLVISWYTSRQGY